MIKFNYLSGRNNKLKERFWILIDHYAGDIGSTTNAGT